jgi:ABC-type transport system substrate-binding protein
MIWAIHVTMAPTWFDPAETPGVITPLMFLYGLHDALVKPMPGNPMFPSLATRWGESPNGLAYDFELRQGVKFHNGDPFTAEEVQFSFQRYEGTGATLLKSKRTCGCTPEPGHVAWGWQHARRQLAEGFTQPADAGRRGERIVYTGGEGPDGDLEQLIDGGCRCRWPGACV